MGWARGALAVAMVFLVAAPARGADLDAMERAVREGCTERARLVEERARRIGEAARLADEIARRKGGTGPTVRADRGLEEALKRFDRVAGQLDEIDRKITDQERTVATARRRLEEAATAEAASLSGRTGAAPIGQVAHELEAIDRARRRVTNLCAVEPAFRPVLDVSISPDDGVSEMQQKLVLLESERDRVLKGIADGDAGEAVLAARILAKRRLSAELDSAMRTAGSDLALLRRESEHAAEGLRALEAQHATLARAKAELSGALVQVEEHLEELRAALRSRTGAKGDVR